MESWAREHRSQPREGFESKMLHFQLLTQHIRVHEGNTSARHHLRLSKQRKPPALEAATLLNHCFPPRLQFLILALVIRGRVTSAGREVLGRYIKRKGLGHLSTSVHKAQGSPLVPCSALKARRQTKQRIPLRSLPSWFYKEDDDFILATRQC